MRTITNPTGQSTIQPHCVAAALMLAGILTSACQGEQTKAATPSPQVVVANVERRDVPVVIELVGQTKGAQDVEIRARIEGFLDDVAFQEGTLVKKGQLLYRIDPKPLQASLANAKADLATWQARHVKTQNDVKRLQPLAAKQAVSQQELDDAVASQEAAQAQVQAQNASVDKAELDLGYTAVSSPITGLVGTTLVRSGALVGRGESTLLTTVSQVDPILFTAGISEAEYLRLSRRADELRRQRGGKPVEVELLLADGTVHPDKGRLDAIERAVDTTTGTLSLQFRFANPGGLIRPGQYGRVRFVLETKQDAMLVPQRAVQELQSLYNVTVVGPDNKLAVKTVTVGPRVGSLWVVEKGLEPGDRVVVEGAQRLKPGTVVTTKDAPPAEAGSGSAEPLPAAEHK
ncbi:MAG TPA: efflux RND transporter periplasmic adaptor subunit [Vicinamibacterales bacterium]|nr:efflux RND transporter periplasmic adaptor subunit [Vicinamibacterales bacterium]